MTGFADLGQNKLTGISFMVRSITRHDIMRRSSDPQRKDCFEKTDYPRLGEDMCANLTISPHTPAATLCISNSALGILPSASAENSGLMRKRKYISTSPLPLAFTLPRYSQSKKSLTRS